jgi:hypothetical protein
MDIKYNILQLSETKYSFDMPYGLSAPRKEDMAFGFNHKISANDKESAIIIELSVIIEDSKNSIKLAENSIRAVFGVEPFKSVVLEWNENGIRVSEPKLMDTFISITIGALRGILAKNFKQTPLDGCVLPLIPMEFIRKVFTEKK